MDKQKGTKTELCDFKLQISVMFKAFFFTNFSFQLLTRDAGKMFESKMFLFSFNDLRLTGHRPKQTSSYLSKVFAFYFLKQKVSFEVLR